METIAKLSLASVLVLLISATVQAQDYYAPTRTPSQQASPGQLRRIQQGDYYKPSTRRLHNRATPAQVRRIQQGDYYKPGRY
jgi:hypothetical protein